MSTLNKSARVFLIAVIVAGALVVLSSLNLSWAVAVAQLRQNIWLYVSMLLLTIISRSFPLYLKPGQAFDLSVISTAAIYLVCGERAAVILYVLGTFCVFEKCEDGSVKSIYNMERYKTLFNMSNIILSIWIPAFICSLLHIDAAPLSLPAMLPKAVVFSIGTYAVNTFLSMTLFSLMGMLKPRDALGEIIHLMPNVMAAMPIGIIIALIYAIPNGGEWIVLIMLLPLMLARYAWKLYLESKNQQMLLIQAIISSMEAKDEYTEGHSRRVRDYALQIGAEMKLNPKDMEKLGIGALLHDVGKIGIEDIILCKPTQLNDEEWKKMRSHPEIGVHIVEGLGFDSDIIDIIRYHHCRYDGKGYPAIPSPSLFAEIMCVADAYDAMTSDRPYRKHFSKEKAFAILREGRETQFSTRAVNAFLRSMGEEA